MSNDGRFGSLMIAKQSAAGVHVPPTTPIRLRGGGDPRPTTLKRAPTFFAGTRGRARSEYAGRDFLDRTIETEPTLADLALALELAFGNPTAVGAQTLTVAAGGAAQGATTITLSAATTGIIPANFPLTFTGGKTAVTTAQAASGATTLTVRPLAAALVAGDSAPFAGVRTITPSTTLFDAFLPLTPFSGQWYVPTVGYTKITDGQLYGVSINVPESREENVTSTWNVHARNAEIISAGTAVAIVRPNYGNLLARLHHSISLGGSAFVMDGTSSINLMNPIEALPANGELTAGFAPSADDLTFDASVSYNGGNTTLLDANDSQAVLPLEWTLTNGGQYLKVIGKVQVDAGQTPVAAGRVVTDATLRGVIETPGDAPFTIEYRI